MLSFAFVLALVSVVFEAMIASRSRALRQLAGRRVSVNLGVSLGLSVVLGVMFGAVGLIALTAGLMSTVMAIPVYRFLHWNFDSAQAVAEGGNRVRFQLRHTSSWLCGLVTTSRRRVEKGWRVLRTPILILVRVVRLMRGRAKP